MLLAQVMIPLAAAAAILFALWFVFDVVRRDQGTDSTRTAGDAVRDGIRSLARRQLGAAGAVALVAAAAAGLVAGYYEDSAEIGLMAAGALLAGALASAMAAQTGMALAASAVPRVAAASSTSASSALSAALGAAAIPGLLAAGLNLAGLAGAFAIVTRILGYPPSQAPYLLAAFALGPGTVALVTRVSGGVFANGTSLGTGMAAPASSAPANAAAAAGRQAAAAGNTAAMSEFMAMQSVATLLLGVALAAASGSTEWLLLPLVLGAVSVFAVIAAALAAQLLSIGTVSQGVLLARALAVALVLGGAGFGAATWALLDDAWYWFFLCGVLGIAAVPVLMLLDRYSRMGPIRASSRVARASRTGPASNVITGLAAGFEATALTAGTLAAALAGAFVLGCQADVPFAGGTVAGLFGIAVAAAGFMLPAPFVSTMPAFAAITAAGTTANRVPGDEGDSEAPDALDSIARDGQLVSHLARAYGAGAAGLAVVLALLAFGELVRASLATIAGDDPERYASLAQDLDLLQPGDDLKFAAANAVAANTAGLEALRATIADDSRFGPWEVRLLVPAARREARGIAASLVDRDALTPREGAAIEPSPLPLPHPLPMSLSRPEVLAAAFAGLTLALIAAAAAVRGAGRSAGRLIAALELQADAPAENGAPVRSAVDPAARSAMRALLPVAGCGAGLPLLTGAAARYAFGDGGNEGWLVIAGIIVSCGIGGVLLASWVEAAGAAWSTAARNAPDPISRPDDDSVPDAPPGPATLAALGAGETIGATFFDAVAPALLVVAALSGSVALAFAPLFIR